MSRHYDARYVVTRLLFLGAVGLGTLLVAEGMLHALRPQANPFASESRYQSDAVIGYVLAANDDTHPDTAVNRYGMRGAEPGLEPKPGTMRIAFVGDSFVYLGERWNDTFPVATAQHLERSLARPVEVINAGVPGYTLEHYFDRLEQQVLPLEPDLVVLGIFLGNDINSRRDPELRVSNGYLIPRNSSRAESTVPWQPHERIHLLRLFGNVSRLYHTRQLVQSGAWHRCFHEDREGPMRDALERARAGELDRDQLADLLFEQIYEKPEVGQAVEARDEFGLYVGLPDQVDRLEAALRDAVEVPAEELTLEHLIRATCPLVRELRAEHPVSGPEWFEPDRGFVLDVLGHAPSHHYDAAAEQIEAIATLCRSHSVPLLLVGIPHQIQVDEAFRSGSLRVLGLEDDFDWSRPGRWLSALSQDIGARALDLTPSFRDEIEGGTDLYRRFDGHWNAAGRASAGRSSAKKILDEQLLQERDGPDRRTPAAAKQ